MFSLDHYDLGTPSSEAKESVTLEIDGHAVTVPAGTSVMRAAAMARTQIPKLCATDTLKAFGSCRLCLVEIEGRVTTGGSKVWQDRLSTTTATLVRKVKAAGMIVIGKTHSVEFAMGGWGTNQYMGTPWNPWDLKTPLTPGGSSSGSGVAVAARLVPCAIGTDTGGSVRLPASWCGIVGLKTTVGRISTYGILPLAPTLDTPGPMTRSVEDAAILFNILQGFDPLDDHTSRRSADDPIPSLRRGVAGLRLATLPDGERTGVDQEVLAAIRRAY